MKRFVVLSVPLALLVACSPPSRKGCKETGCSAGTVCNMATDVCVVSGPGGGDGTTGGGNGGGSGGGSGGGMDGGSGGGGGGGVDGPVIDPFDDGGVFVPGDICTYPLAVELDGGSTVVTVSVDLATASDQYKAVCNGSASGNDMLFAITLKEPKGLIVTATDTSGKSQDGVLALISSPCARFRQAACSDQTTGPEKLTIDRVPAGTWYVLLENYADDSAEDGTYDVQFELVDPPPGPANDSCSGAQALSFTNGLATVTGTTVGAFNDTGGRELTCSSTSALAPDVFYSFTLTQPQDVRVTTTVPSDSDLSPAVAITNTCGVGGAAVQRGCETGADSFLARGLPAGTYFVVVDGDRSLTGEFGLEVALFPATPVPMNDSCAMPMTLVPSVSQMIDANTGNRDYTPSCRGGSSGGDVVYRFTTTVPQRATITATGMNSADGVLSLRAAPCDDDTAEVACQDVETAAPEVITVPNLPAGSYFVVLSAYSAAEGQFGITLELEPPRPPPTNESCTSPETVTLSAAGTATRVADLNLATADIASDLCGTGADGTDLVYELTVPAMQTLTVTADPANSSVDPVIFIRSPVCSGASEDCVDDLGSGSEEELVVTNSTASPTTVFVIVKAYNVARLGEVNLTFSVP